MNKFFSLVLLLAVLGVRKGSARVPVSEFYPFGEQNGDEMVPTADDNFVEHDLSDGQQIYFFNVEYDKIFVNNNGGVSFVRGVPSFTPTCGPTDTPMIIPFWADVDTRNGGSVWYRESTEPELLGKATREVLAAFPGLRRTLDISRIFIVTWDDVAFFGSAGCGAESQAKRNTFQSIVATDGHMSFIIFNYETITWVTGTASGGDCNGRGGTPAKAGFDTGDNVNFYSMDGSCTEEIDQIQDNTNVNQPGRWIFRVDQEHLEDPPEPTEEPITEAPGDNERPGDPGMCDPDDCTLRGYCFTYSQCDPETRYMRDRYCSRGLYWNPHNISTQHSDDEHDGPVIEMGGGSTSSSIGFEQDEGDLDGGHTEIPHGQVQDDTCHGSCDVWQNLPPEVQQQYLADENCFPKCKYSAISDCQNRYHFHPHNTDARNAETVHCPTDSRNGYNVPLVWVQERESCDLCYNVYRTNSDGDVIPCCDKYDDDFAETDHHEEGHEEEDEAEDHYVGGDSGPTPAPSDKDDDEVQYENQVDKKRSAGAGSPSEKKAVRSLYRQQGKAFDVKRKI